MHEKQKEYDFYAVSLLYSPENDTGKVYSLYSVPPDVSTIIPSNPKNVTLEDGKETDGIVVFLGNTLDNIVPYDYFIDSIKTKSYYDCAHILVTVTEEVVEEIVKNYKNV